MVADKQVIQRRSIKDLYPLALAEGEGVGTAYEYFTKRLHLLRWLKDNKPLKHILVAGLPEKYGVSLDFLLLASEMGASVNIIDDRPSALEKASTALESAQKSGYLKNLRSEFLLERTLYSFANLDENFDLILTSETMQRMAAGSQKLFISQLTRRAPKVAIFTPNKGNPDHTNQSGLSGLSLLDIEKLISKSTGYSSAVKSEFSMRTGYLDMPPFPPGITRTDAQREQASSGKTEAIAMWGLGYYARLEQMLPYKWRRRKAHIVFAFIDRIQR